MRLGPWLAALGAAVLAAGCAHRDPAEAALRQAELAMGGSQLRTLHYAGSGTASSFGQAWQPGMAWPRIRLANYRRWVDYDKAALREEFAQSRLEATGGGTSPHLGMGEQRVSAWLRGDHAW